MSFSVGIKPIPRAWRWKSDMIRGGLAGGIIGSFPASVAAVVFAIGYGPTLSVLGPLGLSFGVVGLGVLIGAWAGWAYGIKARGAWLLSKYPRGLCRTCGYDLRGTSGPSCPECGGPLRPAQRRYRDQQKTTAAQTP